MITAIVILSIVVLFLAVSLGVAVSQRRRADTAYHIAKGQNEAITAVHNQLVERYNVVIDALQQERAAHAATAKRLNNCEGKQSPGIMNHVQGNTENITATDMAQEIVKQAAAESISKALNEHLQKTMGRQLGKVNNKFDPRGGRKK